MPSKRLIAINDAGQIVGRHSAGQNAFHAFSFLNGNTTDFSTLGGTNGEALAINKNGLVVGDSDTADGSPHAFVFDHAQLKDLGTLPGFDTASYARGINNSGSIVGESDSADQKRAFLFTKGRLVELDKLAGNLSESGFNSLDVAYDINDKGWIVGYGTTTDHLAAAFLAVPEGRDNQGPAGSTPQPQAQQIEGPPQPQPQDPARSSPVSESDQNDYDVFYSGLSSDEGNWVEAGNYGYCFRPRVTEIGDLTETDTGFGPIEAGTGTPTSVLAGQPTTMADGSISAGPDGAGSPAINGPRRGFPGGKVMKTLAGLLFHPRQMFPRNNRSRPGPTRIMALDRRPTLLSAILTGASRVTRDTSCRPSETFRSSMKPGTSRTLSPTTM